MDPETYRILREGVVRWRRERDELYAAYAATPRWRFRRRRALRRKINLRIIRLVGALSLVGDPEEGE